MDGVWPQPLPLVRRQPGWPLALSSPTRSLAHHTYKDRVVAAKETDAVWSIGVFDAGFPNAPVRTLDNSTLRAWREAGSLASGGRPGEGGVVAHRSDGRPVVRYDFAPPLAGMSGDLEAMANYAGQSVGVVRRRQPAADIGPGGRG